MTPSKIRLRSGLYYNCPPKINSHQAMLNHRSAASGQQEEDLEQLPHEHVLGLLRNILRPRYVGPRIRLAGPFNSLPHPHFMWILDIFRVSD